MPAPPPAAPRAARRRPPAAAVPARPRGDGRRRVRMTRAEYEAFSEAQTDRKYEWVDGEAIEMTGGTVQHTDIKVTLAALLWYAARGRDVKVSDSDLRVRTRGGAGPNRYPDLGVTVGPQRFAWHREDKKLDLLNPTVLFEVLSDSTADEDERGRKFVDYTATPSVTDYVTVDSRAVRAVHRTRSDPDGAWAETELTDPADVLNLPAVGFAATLAEVYEGVRFD